ncbi:Cinorf13 protein [Actinokineospora spheciospongiae]|uniref:Cinorf13 protein n=1 Tax=Actinokineospora spheciospongiae TaxID=909613 RepID=W7IUP4_9PSEU|nr:ImmA/IrrE family metallo-endopeptidase [Actinokineospora spheciospongiae]EWC64650.1 Cinorf13 protein [Actinokineospora spheciospongiae]PWW56955.1 uncharacterized protein DUF955 [Actinokineospora spheciospongiae]
MRGLAEHRRLRRRVRELLAEVGVPRPWDLGEFCARVAAHRGRPIHVLPMVMPPGAPDGAWLSGPTVDLIVHDADSPPLRAEHIVCHELGHILLGHGGTGLGPELTPDVSPDLLRRMGVLHRAGYDDVMEQQAEVAASLIWRLADRRLVPDRRALDPTEAAVVDRFAEVMERRADGGGGVG